MATKEQERKALEQIKKIVEGLGENSYIGTAFEGCFEIAEDNIKNDFACSMKQAKEMAEKQFVEAKDIIKCREQELADREKEVRELRKTADMLNSMRNELLERLRIAEEAGSKIVDERSALSIKCKEQEEEIIRLKAKLYDLITK